MALTKAQQDSMNRQLDAAKATLLSMQSSLSAPKTTSTKTSSGSSRSIPVSGASSNLTPYQQENEFAAQNIRFGIAPGTPTTYTPISRTSDGSYSASAPSFSRLAVNVNNTVPSTALTSNVTASDVYRQQSLYQNQNDINSFLGNMSKDAGFATDPSANFLTNPDKFLASIYADDYATPAQKKQQDILDRQADATEDFYEGREKNVKKAYDQAGVSKASEELGAVNKQIAERQVKLRNELQQLTTAPEYRGVSREFANDYQQKVKSDAAFDMANLAIVQQALAGNYDRAKEIAEDLVDAQYDAFKGQIEAYQAKLDALAPQLSREQKKKAEMTQIALDERSRLLDDAKDMASLKNDYLIAAIKAGAPQSVWQAIQNSTSPEEALFLAAPYIQKGAQASSASYNTYTGESGYNTPLASMDFYGSKTSSKELQAAVQQQFGPEMSSLLLKTLSDEQLRNFLTEFDNKMVSQKQNIDPMRYFTEVYAPRNGIKLPGAEEDDLMARINKLGGTGTTTTTASPSYWQQLMGTLGLGN
jgi:hypothetical protein